MKINGLVFDGPKPVTCVIPVGEQQMVFTLKPVLDFEEFDKLCPRPEPGERIDNKGIKSKDYNHPKYLENLEKYSHQRMDWMYLKSIEDSEGLEWEQVKMEDPETWHLFHDELKAAGVPDAYIDHFKVRIIQVCGLDPERIDEATQRFLASQAQERKSS